ncbi:CNH domain-containing protein [Phthorimaea operculella]|nr:CNH domain-containing protein [Phthorimaea operculella]
MTEYNEVTDRLSELRQQKQKLSRQVRDKEEELEVAMQKIDALRADIRRSDKGRRELEARLDAAIAEATKERKLREESLRNQRVEAAGPPGSAQADVARLQAEVNTLEMQYKESLVQQQSRYSAEISALRDQLQETDALRQALTREISALRDQLQETDALRQALTRELQSSKEKLESRRLEQLNDSEDKNMLINENRKLAKDLDAMAENGRRWQTERRQLELELEELRAKKETMQHWESQIADIIRWVSDEKEARGYLQALATKMTEELEYLKHASTPRGSAPPASPPGAPPGTGGWRNRRSQKLDKMEILTLQSSLHSEIQAKQQVGEELSRTRAELLASQRELHDTRTRLEALAHDIARKEQHIREMQTRLDQPALPPNEFLDRPTSQMSYLDQFMKEAQSERHYDNVPINSEPKMSPQYRYRQIQHCCNAKLMYGSQQSAALSGSAESQDEMEGRVSPASSKSSPSESTDPSLGPAVPGKQKVHQFLVRTFSSPTKCNHCTSLMIGLTRQGVVCETCGLCVHTRCCARVAARCPLPPERSRRPLGIDPARGQGTAYEGYVKVPKPGGVKKGWMRQFVVVCDFKLFLYDISQDRNALPSVCVSQVLDMRDPDFSVTSVKESDVIHASKRDIACIFRISTSQLEGGKRSHTLMLAESESEKTKWVVALSELHRILKRNNLPDKCEIRLVKKGYQPVAQFLENNEGNLVSDPEKLKTERTHKIIGYADGLALIGRSAADVRAMASTPEEEGRKRLYSCSTRCNSFSHGKKLFSRVLFVIHIISTSQLEGGKRSHTLMLAESESEKTKWVVALSELHRILKRNNLPDKCLTESEKTKWVVALSELHRILKRNNLPDKCLTESEKTKWVVALSELHRILKRNNLPDKCLRMVSESEKTKWVVALSELHRILKRNNLPDKCLTESEKTKWVVALSELHRILKRNNLPDKCGGLALVDLERGEITPRRQHAPVAKALYVPTEQLLVTIAGRGRHVRLVPIRALECSEVECVKIAESKGCVDVAVGELHAQAMGFAVVCKRQNSYMVTVYEITRTAARRMRIAELRAPSAVHVVQLVRGRLLLGYRGGVAAHCLPDPRQPARDQPAHSLVHPENQVSVFLSHSGARPLAAAPVPNSQDTLLVFNSLALYVDRCGHRARDTELMYTAQPLHHALVHPENQVSVFLSHSGARPLAAAPVPNSQDTLLVFNSLALYVDRCGHRARDTELMYTAQPLHHGKKPKYGALPPPALVHPENQVSVFLSHSGARPLAAAPVPNSQDTLLVFNSLALYVDRCGHRARDTELMYTAQPLHHALVHPENQVSVFLSHSGARPLAAAPVPNSQDTLLVFNSLALYVDRCGHRARDTELMYTAQPLHHGKKPKYGALPPPALVHPENQVSVFLSHSGARPLAAAPVPNSQDTLLVFNSLALYVDRCGHRARDTELMYTAQPLHHGKKPKYGALPPPALVHPENQVSVFLSHSGARPLAAAPVPNSQDTLLVFNSLALYVDRCGHRARDTELMYTAQPLHHGKKPKYGALPPPALVHPENQVSVFLSHSGARPLAAAPVPNSQDTLLVFNSLALYVDRCGHRARDTELMYTAQPLHHALVHPENQVSVFLSHSGARPLAAAPVPNSQDTLLVFNSLALYVDRCGHRARDTELMYTAQPLHHGKKPKYGALPPPALVHPENQVSVFLSHSGARPLAAAPVPNSQDTLLVFNSLALYVDRCGHRARDTELMYTAQPLHHGKKPKYGALPPPALVHPENQVSVFLSHSGARPLAAAPVPNSQDTLLVFNSLALYVDRCGHRARDTELMYTAQPLHHALVHPENQVSVFLSHSGARPLAAAPVPNSQDTLLVFNSLALYVDRCGHRARDTELMYTAQPLHHGKKPKYGALPPPALVHPENQVSVFLSHSGARPLAAAPVPNSQDTLLVFNSLALYVDRCGHRARDTELMYTAQPLHHALVHPENQVSVFLSHSGARPLAAAPVPNSQDTLLVFNSLALYVDRCGHRARDTELMYTAQPLHHGKKPKYGALPPPALVHPENQVSVFLSHSGARPLAAAPVPNSQDTLLVFNSLALYVDRCGHRARDTELMYTAQPLHHALVHPENQVSVFLSHSGARPLAAAPVPNSQDTLLVFNSLALYVDRCGHRARDTELMYTAQPLHHGKKPKYGALPPPALVHPENQVSVFLSHSGARPLAAAPVPNSQDTLLVFNSLALYVDRCGHRARDTELMYTAQPLHHGKKPKYGALPPPALVHPENQVSVFLSHSGARPLAAAPVPNSQDTLLVFNSLALYVDRCGHRARDTELMYTAQPLHHGKKPKYGALPPPALVHPENQVSVFLSHSGARPLAAAPVPNSQDTLLVFNSLALYVDRCGHRARDTELMYTAQPLHHGKKPKYGALPPPALVHPENQVSVFLSHSGARPLAAAPVPNSQDTLLVFNSLALYVDRCGHRARDTELMYTAQPLHHGKKPKYGALPPPALVHPENQVSVFLSHSGARPLAAAPVPNSQDTLLVFNSLALGARPLAAAPVPNSQDTLLVFNSLALYVDRCGHRARDTELMYTAQPLHHGKKPKYGALPPALVHPENQVSVFLSHSGARPLAAAPVPNSQDTLLVFNSLALYVDRCGHRARDTELMYTAQPLHHALVHPENQVSVFLSHSGARPLAAAPVPNSQDTLLVFNSLALYVDRCGHRARDTELMYTAQPLHHVHHENQESVILSHSGSRPLAAAPVPNSQDTLLVFNSLALYVDRCGHLEDTELMYTAQPLHHGKKPKYGALPPPALVHPENQVSVFLSHSGARPLAAAPVPNSQDTLLVFNSLALYVDRCGHRARDTELMYTAQPLHHGKKPKYGALPPPALVHPENQVSVFLSHSGARPLAAAPVPNSQDTLLVFNSLALYVDRCGHRARDTELMYTAQPLHHALVHPENQVSVFLSHSGARPLAAAPVPNSQDTLLVFNSLALYVDRCGHRARDTELMYTAQPLHHGKKPKYGALPPPALVHPENQVSVFLSHSGARPLAAAPVPNSQDTLLVFNSLALYVDRSLVHPENQVSVFLSHSGARPLAAAPVPNSQDTLLVFNSLALYVDRCGHRARDTELMYTAQPLHHALVHPENQVSVFLSHSGARPLAAAPVPNSQDTLLVFNSLALSSPPENQVSVFLSHSGARPLAAAPVPNSQDTLLVFNSLALTVCGSVWPSGEDTELMYTAQPLHHGKKPKYGALPPSSSPPREPSERVPLAQRRATLSRCARTQLTRYTTGVQLLSTVCGSVWPSGEDTELMYTAHPLHHGKKPKYGALPTPSSSPPREPSERVPLAQRRATLSRCARTQLTRYTTGVQLLSTVCGSVWPSGEDTELMYTAQPLHHALVHPENQVSVFLSHSGARPLAAAPVPNSQDTLLVFNSLALYVDRCGHRARDTELMYTAQPLHHGKKPKYGALPPPALVHPENQVSVFLSHSGARPLAAAPVPNSQDTLLVFNSLALTVCGSVWPSGEDTELMYTAQPLHHGKKPKYGALPPPALVHPENQVSVFLSHSGARPLAAAPVPNSQDTLLVFNSLALYVDRCGHRARDTELMYTAQPLHHALVHPENQVSVFLSHSGARPLAAAPVPNSQDTLLVFNSLALTVCGSVWPSGEDTELMYTAQPLHHGKKPKYGALPPPALVHPENQVSVFLSHSGARPLAAAPVPNSQDTLLVFNSLALYVDRCGHRARDTELMYTAQPLHHGKKPKYGALPPPALVHPENQVSVFLSHSGARPLAAAPVPNSQDTLLVFNSLALYVDRSLVHPENQVSVFLSHSGARPLAAAPVPNSQDTLLVFNSLALYVDRCGHRARDTELMYTAQPLHHGKKPKYGALPPPALVHPENQVSVFLSHSGARPLAAAPVPNSQDTLLVFNSLALTVCGSVWPSGEDTELMYTAQPLHHGKKPKYGALPPPALVHPENQVSVFLSHSGARPLAAAPVPNSQDTLLVFNSLALYVDRSLVHPENQVSVFLSHSGARPLAAAPVPNSQDTLLVFNSLALYVDRCGHRARDTELMYTAQPLHHGKKPKYGALPPPALVHPENQVSVFLSHSGARPLAAAPVPNSQDTLLVFNSLALYVDRCGHRARDTELMYTAQPLHHGKKPKYGALPPPALVHPENQVSVFLSHSGARPLAAAPVPNSQDTLLVFNSLALYVDRCGHRARDTELMYTAQPLHHAINETHLLIFTATHIDIYDIESGEWVQTINIPNARPLDECGWICSVGGSGTGFPFSSDTAPIIIYLRPLLSQGPLSVEHAFLCSTNKRRFSVREQSHQAIEAHNRLSERRSRLISAPTNFAHLSHMGPGDGIRSQRLLDLPTTVETADDRSQQVYSSRESSKRTSPLTISQHGTGSYNGSWRSVSRPREGPPAAPDHPPSPPLSHHRPMERSIGGGSAGSGSLLERSITPLSLGSMSSLHDVLKVGTELGEGLVSEDSSCGASPPHPHEP